VEFPADQFVRLLRQRRPLEEHAADPLSQRADAPPLNAAHFRVEITFQGRVQWDDFDEMAPTQLSRQCRDNWLVRKSLGKLDHPPNSLLCVATAKFGRQV